ncbi:hypothetical protein TREMEDRAFT_30153, partial [Tremella mesenterica DSM 1558]|uniref:uncharacterized protein n=1 Tax=Tremella mesenterica (strain ATCC 24925 / CBS 8224 / DSM 1558 / NBRC 9311 / NRRL Y-6157 / RJB 2259-6 / UBC 559-6) TaxID=578456 RepID=UPI0003F48D16
MVSNQKTKQELRLCGGKDRRQIEIADKVLQLIATPTFWTDLESLTRILQPLTIAAHALQSNTTRLDEVFLTLGCLYTQYTSEKNTQGRTPGENEVTHWIIQSLEKRWAFTDQDLFVAAALLNPFFGRHRLGMAPGAFPGATRYELIRRVYCRLFQPPSNLEPPELYQHWLEYTMVNPSVHFSDSALGLQTALRHAKNTNTSPDPIVIWRQLDIPSPSPLKALALRLYAVVPNSAGNERIFSQYSDIATKKRNWLSPEKM